MAKKSTARDIVPTYMTGKRPLRIGLRDVIDVLRLIESRKQTSRLRRAAASEEMTVLVEPKTVNLIKDFMVKHRMHDHKIGKIVINPRPPAGAKPSARSRALPAAEKDPYECDFSKH